MRARNGSRLILLALLGLLADPGSARADFAQCTYPLPACTATTTGCCERTFAQAGGRNPLIIPMDRCHQRIAQTTMGPPGAGAPRVEISITSISRAGSTVTVNTTGGLANNAVIEVSETGNGQLDGTFKISAASSCSPNCTTATYTTATSGAIGAIATGKILRFNTGQGWCVDPIGADAARIGGAVSDDGMYKVYGLIYRLMQRGIPVYWVVNPTKAVPAITTSNDNYLATDVDGWVLTSDLSSPPSSGAGLTDCLTTASCTQPVHRLAPATLAPFMDSYQRKQFPLRGGVFVIAAEDRARFDDFWLRQGDYAGLAGKAKYNWPASGIDLYELDPSAKLVYQNFTSGSGTSSAPFAATGGLPVAVRIDYEPPRIACIGCNNNLTQQWLDKAGLLDAAQGASCPSGEFVPSDAVYCPFTEADIGQGVLVSGGFTWAWVFGFNDNSPCANSAEIAMFDRLRDFMTTIPAIRNAGHSMFLDASIKVAEGCPNKQMKGRLASNGGLNTTGSNQSEPYILRYPSNLFMQFGDVPIEFAGGTVSAWIASTATMKYQDVFAAAGSTLRRLVTVDRSTGSNTECLNHTSTASCDVFDNGGTTGDHTDTVSYARFQNLLINGLILYLTGTQIGGKPSELRMLLSTLIALPDESYTVIPTELEVSRTTPIVAMVDVPTVFQGTYVRLDPPPAIPKATTASGLVRFTFPYLQGHLRAIPVESYVACTGASCDANNDERIQFGAMADITFDAADHIPAASPAGCAIPFNGLCRSVFTTTARGYGPAAVNQTFFSTTNRPTLGPLIGSNLNPTEQETLISRILAGIPDGSGGYVSRLGGIDRSIPAVIGPSPLAGSQGRPTMAYFGAMDGMLHAVCASDGDACVKGRELWAFIPRTLLSDLRQSTARIDGSPRVIDAYGTFEPGQSAPGWRTILLFHTGTGRMANNNVVPAVYALDITNPFTPKVLWEYSVEEVAPCDGPPAIPPPCRGSVAMGVGLTITAGTVLVSGARKTVAFVQTTNGGTGGAGSVVTAIDVETGTELWQKADPYPNSSGRPGESSHEKAPASAIPGGAVGLDKNGAGNITDVVYGTIYGDVFQRAADNGDNRNVAPASTSPLLRINADYHPIGVPPAIYFDSGAQYAAFVTGGYADSQLTLWNGANETPRPTQFMFAVNLDYAGPTINQNNPANVPLKIDFASNLEGGFAQVMIVGGELFIVTDKTNVNSYDYGAHGVPTGNVYRYDFGGATPAQGATQIIAGGAAALFNYGTQLLSSGGSYGERLKTDALGTVGTSVDPMTTASDQLLRKLWLRTE
jgi:hypothetical protein